MEELRRSREISEENKTNPNLPKQFCSLCDEEFNEALTLGCRSLDDEDHGISCNAKKT